MEQDLNSLNPLNNSLMHKLYNVLIKNLKLFFFIIVFFVSANVHAQLIDSIKNCLTQKPRFNAKFDNRNSFVSNSRARIFGVKAGLEYNNHFVIGIGYNFLNSEIDKEFYSVVSANDTINTKLRFNYISIFAEYVFYDEKKYQLSIPIQIGAGVSKYTYSLNNKIFNYKNKPVIIYETALLGHYKIIKWVAIGGGIGYRLMILDNPNIDQQFNSVVYVIKVKIFLADIYRDIFVK